MLGETGEGSTAIVKSCLQKMQDWLLLHQKCSAAVKRYYNGIMYIIQRSVTNYEINFVQRQMTTSLECACALKQKTLLKCCQRIGNSNMDCIGSKFL